MVSYSQALILGIVQGITEWLPISSSGHLVLFQKLFGISPPVAFNVFLHLGSFIVVLIVFRKDIKSLLIGVLKKDTDCINFFIWIIIASLPIAFVGLFFNDFIKSIFYNVRIVGISLIFTSMILFLSKYPQVKNENLNLRKAIIIGAMQAITIIPGISRSGITISTGLIQRVEGKESARFSFLLFIPVIIGATIVEGRDLDNITNIGALLFGMVITVIVGFFSLKLLLKVIEQQKFNYFGYYCLVLGLIVLYLSS